MVRASNVLGSDKGQGKLWVIVRVRVILGLWLESLFDHNSNPKTNINPHPSK